MQQNASLHTGAIVKGNKFTYTIQSVLGQGSFGITYLASTHAVISGPLGDIETEVKVAIKEFFMKEFSSRRDDGTITEMTDGSLVQNYARKFRKEAENLAKMSHPGIVKVLEVFEANNTCYYAMQYIAGGSLDAYVKSRGGLPEEEAVECIRQIGDAVKYMHDHKMLHLDLKPGNVMRSEDGKKMFLIDFGLSKQYSSNGEPESSTTIGLGTPGYAPIEQSNTDRDRDFAPTLDVYALGATFFKLLIGETPPKASDVLNEGLPLEKLRQKGVSQTRINAIEKAMEPRKGMRAKSIKEFLAFLSNNENEKDSEDTIVTDIILKDSRSEKVNTNSAKEKSDLSEPKPSKKPLRFSKWIIWICAGVIAIIVAVLFWPSHHVLETSQDENIIPKAQVDSVSYLVGVNFGSFIKSNGFGTGLLYSEIQKGISDYLNAVGSPSDPDFNKQFKINPDSMNDTFNTFLKGEQKSNIQDVSYLVGINFGSFIKSYGFGTGLQYSEIQKGMSDYINAKGNPSDSEFSNQFKISPDKMNDVFNRFFDKKKQIISDKNKKEEQAYLLKIAKEKGVKVTESGLQYRIIKQGNNVHAHSKDTVEVTYIGKLINGEVFDKSEEPISLQLNRVIPGWTEGLQLIGEGGKIELYIPSSLAYGEEGNQVIEPNSTLIFSVDLLKVKREKI